MWEDCTSYGRYTKNRKQTCYDIKGSVLRIAITCAHINAPGKWVMHCDPWFNTYPLNIDDINDVDGAKMEALKLVKDKLKSAINDIESFEKITGE